MKPPKSYLNYCNKLVVATAEAQKIMAVVRSNGQLVAVTARVELIEMLAVWLK